MIASFNRFEIEMTKAQAESCSHPGPCDSDVLFLSKNPKIIQQFKKIDPLHVAAELKEYCGWNAEELKDTEQNIQRILWIAAGYIVYDLKKQEVT
jgi:hypothetical protein